MNTRAATAAVAAVLAATITIAVGCGGDDGGNGSSTSGSGGGQSAAPGNVSGPVKVLYAGSLTDLMEHKLGPAFEQASGASFQGYASGSTELAQQIKGKVRQGDVFVSASPDADAAAGSFVTWYATFANSPVLIGYNPKSRYAADFKTKPWYEVIGEPGIRVGRTDPKLDPKGEKTVAAIDQAAAKLDRPQLRRTLSKFPVYPEETLTGRLQSGQLDAGFFYSIESKAIGVPTVNIKPAFQQAVYTVTVLKGAPDQKAAETFVRYLLGAKGTATLERAGFRLVSPPTVSGDKSAVPSSLQSVLGGG